MKIIQIHQINIHIKKIKIQTINHMVQYPMLINNLFLETKLKVIFKFLIKLKNLNYIIIYFL